MKARYSKYYKIDKEMLEWLIERVEHLRELVKTACEERIEELEALMCDEKCCEI